MTRYICDSYAFLTSRIYLISWISLVTYIFYDTYIYYMSGRQFHYLRQILGLGLCVSRGGAAVLNVCCALVLVPLCKKLNQALYRILSQLCPGLFFLWLEKAKSFHMTVAITLFIFAVVHSISHFINIWNFSRNYDDVHPEINMAEHRDESAISLLVSVPGISGVSMLVIVVCMAATSSRFIRRRLYNAFWYTHQLYLPFMVLLLIHPLSGVLKEEILDEKNKDVNMYISYKDYSTPKFVTVNSMTWMWMVVPLTCFSLDLIWRVLSRNSANVRILNVSHMAGRTLNLTVSCPEKFTCRMGQYVLLQCSEISVMEWHPFTVVRVPTCEERSFVVWIKVKGDWTEALEKCLMERSPDDVSVLIDGPFSSPMEGVRRSEVAICVAAGVGITPFVAVLTHVMRNPRERSPGRIHLIWIVRYERELTWLAAVAERAMKQLQNANRPDRLHLEFYVTNVNDDGHAAAYSNSAVAHTIVMDEKGDLVHVLARTDDNDEMKTLLTPNWRRKYDEGNTGYDVAKRYPLVGCRVKRGRPHWDKVFGYWVHLYPGHKLNLYCCGPKKLVKLLRDKCKYMSRESKTNFTFVHEAFS